MVIGQEKICNQIYKHTLDTFPRSLLLLGPSGAGKHLICNEISSHFQLRIVELTDILSQEIIDTIYHQVEPNLYIIQLNCLTVKEENMILKFLEEPLKNAYIVLLAEHLGGVLPTIINRCQVWNLQNYSKEYLSNFTNGNIDLLEIVETPGQALALSTNSFTEMIELADKMIYKISTATIPNTLTIVDKMAWNNEKNKLNYDLFVKVLLSRVTHACREHNDSKLYDYYYLTSELLKNNFIKNIDKKYLFEKFVLEARSIMKGSIV